MGAGNMDTRLTHHILQSYHGRFTQYTLYFFRLVVLLRFNGHLLLSTQTNIVHNPLRFMCCFLDQGRPYAPFLAESQPGRGYWLSFDSRRDR